MFVVVMWRAAYRDWKRLELFRDQSFEPVCLFSLLGLVLSMWFLWGTSPS
jgi:hypothetical protein